MKPEAAVIAVMMFSLSLYGALFFDDAFMPIVFWLLGVMISVGGLIAGDKKVE